MKILTCGPGEPLYALFGHTALWVQDPVNHIDEVYNFGTFDMQTSNFYFKFLTGRLNYALTCSSFDHFIAEYRQENRWVCSQEVCLPPETISAIYDSLRIIHRPENRYYRYDFFHENCASRVFDLLLAFAGEKQNKPELKKTAGLTYRQALETYTSFRPWIAFGINVLLGPEADQEISRQQSTFLPDFLMSEAEKIKLAGAPLKINNGSFNNHRNAQFNFISVFFWILLLFLVIEALWLKSTKFTSKMIDLLLFGSSAMLGSLLLFFWIWSLHSPLHANYNLQWALPLNLILLWSVGFDKTKWNRVHLFLYALLLFFLLINWVKIPQSLPLELMPLVTALAFRSLNIVFAFGKTKMSDKIIPFQDSESGKTI